MQCNLKQGFDILYNILRYTLFCNRQLCMYKVRRDTIHVQREKELINF
jgi:hypothetical protein